MLMGSGTVGFLGLIISIRFGWKIAMGLLQRRPPMANKPIELERFEPDYESKCFVCKASPTVTGVRNGKVIVETDLCGPCTWGTAQALDVEWWNSGEE